MTVPDAISLREITDPRDPAIDAFGRVQSAVYFAPETLIPAGYIPDMLAGDGDDEARTGARHNFLVVAERDGTVVGGTLFHWLADAGSGFSSFLGIDRAFQGQGVARRLHERRLVLLDRAAGGAEHLAGVFIDVVNPTRLSPDELEREAALDSDPWTRRRAFERFGFRQVAIRYEQPVGGPNGGPVTSLDLLFCPRLGPRATVPTELVVATMRAYWSGWLENRADAFAEQLRERAQGRSELALLSSVPDAR